MYDEGPVDNTQFYSRDSQNVLNYSKPKFHSEFKKGEKDLNYEAEDRQNSQQRVQRISLLDNEEPKHEANHGDLKTPGFVQLDSKT